METFVFVLGFGDPTVIKIENKDVVRQEEAK